MMNKKISSANVIKEFVSALIKVWTQASKNSIIG